jgi:hypothetical protein
MDLQG